MQFYFNPRSDERSDVMPLMPGHMTCKISIHAPTNGATPVSDLLGGIDTISIHAPTNGATAISHYHPLRYKISIHAPTNGATDNFITADIPYNISIHAPTNGATRASFTISSSLLFQSTLRRTERLSVQELQVPSQPIQSTLRRTERPNYYIMRLLLRYFNPRSDERSDYVSHV